jgi:muramoyltetrapeptide carboxypeptidase LdcA involved in peptidoglycan recycling
MNLIYPDKLKSGDEVRIISPSRSMSIIKDGSKKIANDRFAELGLKLSFGKHVDESDDFVSSSIASRVEDIHEAFSDPNVKAVLTVIGGFNSNQLLRDIDWGIIINNPKIFCGFSDITALNNSILAKTGLVTYSGTHYSTFGMRDYFEYNLEYFKKCLMTDESYEVKPSEQWTDDMWFMNQDRRQPVPNKGWSVINEGQASGTIVGGNLCTLNLLQGTEFMPDLTDSILFLEDDEESMSQHFDRNLVSLIQQPGFSGVKGIVFGRFQVASKMSNEIFVKLIASKKELSNLPIIANFDIGHTNPMVTFPVGGTVELNSSNAGSKITITKH